MSELSHLISRLRKGISRDASYVSTIRYPQLLLSSLRELNSLIGNDKVKDSVATQVSHLIMIKRRAMEDSRIKEDEVMLNTVLYGPPGVGKTLIGAKLAKIWYSLGYLDGTKNSKEKKHELGDMLKDLFKDNGTSSSSDDTAATYAFFVFIIIFVTLLSMMWSFYSRFGGAITIAAIAIIVAIALIVGYYIYYGSETTNDTTSDKTFDQKHNNISTESNIVDERNYDGNTNDGLDCRDGTGSCMGAEGAYCALNMPSDDQVIKVVTRADFVDKYVGWSDKKTVKLLEENLGKVLFVDEAYSLVTDMHDSFGIEVLTAINLFLSQHSKEIIVIFAGYKDLMETGIFSFQPGLRRRFMWQFDCSGYTEDQMFDIFKLQLCKKGWGLSDEDATRNIFRKNKDAFPAFGGDTERLAFFSELEHSRDFITNERRMIINKLSPEHVRKGIFKLRENNIQGNPDEAVTNPLANMMKMLRGDKKNSSDNSDVLSAMKNASSDRAYF